MKTIEISGNARQEYVPADMQVTEVSAKSVLCASDGVPGGLNTYEQGISI